MIGSKAGIVVNRMFVGDYLTSNLGHEIINLFQADNGNHYLYLNAYGNFNKTHKDKIGIMLMVKSVGGNILSPLLEPKRSDFGRSDRIYYFRDV